MLALGIVILILFLIAVLRVGVILEYSDSGFNMWLKIGLIKMSMNSKNEDNDSDFISKIIDIVFKQLEKSKEAKKKPKKPMAFPPLRKILQIVKKVLSRIRRKLCIKQLTLYYKIAGNLEHTDPATTARNFTICYAVFALMTRIIESNLNIKKCDLRTGCDYLAEKPEIYAKLSVSIAIWEAIYIAVAIIPMFTARRRTPKPVKT